MSRYKDPARLFSTFDPNDGADLFDVRRYSDRAAEFDHFLASSHDRYWDPADDRFLDLQQPFEVAHEWLMPREWFPELRSAVADRLDEEQQVRLGNEIIRWMLSGILHGEQAALHVCAQLCIMFKEPAVQEFLVNQAREEARHANAFARYINVRWGEPYPVGAAFGSLLREVLAAADVERKLIGVGVLVESFAMGAFANIQAHTKDPALGQMMKALLRDEASHHSAGAFWLDQALKTWPEDRRRTMAGWAARGFRALYLNLVSVHQRRAVYGQFGLEWQWVRDAVREMRGVDERTPGLEEDTNPLSVLAQTLDKSGLLTAQERSQFDTWLGDAL